MSSEAPISFCEPSAMLPLFALAAATAPTHLRPQGQMQKTIRRIGMMRQERPRATPAAQGKEEDRDEL